MLDVYSRELPAFYAESGPVRSARFPAGWCRTAQPLEAMPVESGAADRTWRMPQVEPGHYQLIGYDSQHWQLVQSRVVPGPANVTLPSAMRRVELVRDRRTPRPPTPTLLRRRCCTMPAVQLHPALCAGFAAALRPGAQFAPVDLQTHRDAACRARDHVV